MLRDLVPSVWSRPLASPTLGLRRETDPFRQLERHFDRFFEDFWRDVGSPTHVGDGKGLQMLMSPRVDISETEKEYLVSAELPGMNEKDIEVNFADGMLVIKGEKTEERKEEQQSYYLRERSYGHFHREIPLNAEINVDKITANYSNGILTIHLPKTEDAQKRVKRIPVKA